MDQTEMNSLEHAQGDLENLVQDKEDYYAQGEEATQQTDREDQGEFVQDDQETDQERMERAKRQGWVPPEEYAGKGKAIGYDEFLEKGEQEWPLLKSQLKKYDREVVELKQSVKEMYKMMKDSHERGYQEAMQDLQKQKRQAVEEGDTDMYDQIEKREKALADSRLKEEAQVKTESYNLDPEVISWQKSNSWYGVDNMLSGFLETMVKDGMQTAPGVPMYKHLENATLELKRRFPEKFGISSYRKRANIGSVEGGMRSAPSNSNAKSYSNLPKEAKKQCDIMVKQGIMTKDDYVKYYDWGDSKVFYTGK